jgi:glycosyltransferase 2 family protein
LRLSRIVRLLVAVGLTAFILWKANPQAVLDAMRGADPLWIAAAIVLVLFDRALMAWRWIDLLAALSPGSRPPFSVVLRIFFFSSFVGTFLPSIAGDAYRAYSLSRHRVRMSESAASVLMDRILGVLSMVLLGAIALTFAPEVPRDRWTALWLAAAGSGCLVVAFVVFNDRAGRLLDARVRALPVGRVQRAATSLTEAVRRYANHHGELGRVLTASMLVQGLRVLQAFCLARAIGIVLPLTTFFVYIPISVLLMQVPVTISGLGTTQVAFVWLFGQAGVRADAATALSLLFLALGVVGSLPGAFLYIAGERPAR